MSSYLSDKPISNYNNLPKNKTMKKTTESSNSTNEKKVHNTLDITDMLFKYGVTLHENNMVNYMQSMKKPFIGWTLSLEYDENTNYEALLVKDVISLERANFIEKYNEKFRNYHSDLALSELNKPSKI